MNRNEFIRQLEDTLKGEVPSNVIRDNITYYESYIDEELKKHGSEESILDALGDPRLIAKTIIDTSEPALSSENTEEYDTRSQGEQGNPSYKQLNINTWYWKLAGIAIVVLILFIIISIFAGIFNLLFIFAGPLCIILFIVILVKSFKKK